MSKKKKQKSKVSILAIGKGFALVVFHVARLALLACVVVAFFPLVVIGALGLGFVKGFGE